MAFTRVNFFILFNKADLQSRLHLRVHPTDRLLLKAMPLMKLWRPDGAKQQAAIVGCLPQRDPIRRRQRRRLEWPRLLLQQVDQTLHLRQPRLLLVPLGLLQCLLPLHRLLPLHLVVVELGKVVDNDGNGQRHDEDAGNGAAGADKLTQAGLGADVPVPHGGHRDNGPPEGGGDRGEACKYRIT